MLHSLSCIIDTIDFHLSISLSDVRPLIFWKKTRVQFESFDSIEEPHQSLAIGFLMIWRCNNVFCFRCFRWILSLGRSSDCMIVVFIGVVISLISDVVLLSFAEVVLVQTICVVSFVICDTGTVGARFVICDKTSPLLVKNWEIRYFFECLAVGRVVALVDSIGRKFWDWDLRVCEEILLEQIRRIEISYLWCHSKASDDLIERNEQSKNEVGIL